MKKLLIFCSIFILIFIEFFHPITAFTQDLGRHLKLGSIILQTHTIPQTNLFSYTYPTFPFINTHWLSEVLFFLLTRAFGIQGLLFILSLTAAFSFSLMLLTSLIRTNKIQYLAFFIVSFLYAGILLERSDLRPEIFSFLFLSLFLCVLYTNRTVHFLQRESVENKRKNKLLHFLAHVHPPLWLFFLPIIEILWVNMHIYFLIGPLLISLFFLDALVTLLSSGSLSHPPSTYAVLLFFSLVFTSLSCLLNPYGLQGALYPFTVFHNYGYSIVENQNIFFLIQYGFLHSSYLYFFGACGLMLFLLLFNRKKSQPIDWLLFIVFSSIAFSAIRNVPLFVFATFPTGIFLFPSTISKLVKNHVLWIGIISIAFIFHLYLFTSQHGFGNTVVPGAEGGVKFFLAHSLHGPIFNNFDIGSYLDYRLYPAEKVFVDGRPEAYPASFFKDVYIPMQENPQMFSNMEEKYNFSTIFFSYTDQTPWAQQFIIHIMQNPSWQLVYLDDFSSIWVKKITSNTTMLQKFAILQDTFIIPSLQNSQGYYHLLYFFHLLDWPDAQGKIAQKIVSFEPNNCDILSVLAENPSLSFLYTQRYKAVCK